MAGRSAGVVPVGPATARATIAAARVMLGAARRAAPIESVTRVFYARADLDLIMSSPVRLTNIFSVRIAAIALSVTAMALLLSSPFVDVLVIGGGIRWFSAFGVESLCRCPDAFQR